ncbi:hypothetical protein [Agaribacterium haliotis]|uniref:hypothetical protein n=1 Tax=Agaribacterium haliotis TaxID=2013869 RepID=UPI000BB562D1|nr:hypothetical protein [Agaribacterium haliotis]
MTMYSLRSVREAQRGAGLSKHQSLRCLVDGEERLLCDHYERPHVGHEIEIVDLSDASASLHLVHHRKAGRVLTEISMLSRQRSWTIENDRLLDDQQNTVAVLSKVGPHFRSLLEQIAELESMSKVVTDEHKRRVQVAMFKAPEPDYSGIDKVVQLFRNPRDTELARFKVLAWPESPSLALAIVMLQLINQGEGQG